MKTITINGSPESMYARSDTFIVPAVGSSVTYFGPALGAEGTKEFRFRKIKARITSIHAPHGVMAPTVRLYADGLGDAGCDVSCETLAETQRDDIATLRELEQTCAAWLAAHRAGNKDGCGESFQGPIDNVFAKPGVDRERIERLAAAAVVTAKYVPYIPGTNDIQEAAMKSEGLLA